MALDYSNTALLRNWRRRSFAPVASAAGTSDQDGLEMMTEEARSRALPLIKGLREEYLVGRLDVALVAGQAIYRVPTRAAGGAIRGVTYLDTNAVEQPLNELRSQDMRRVAVSSAVPEKYYFEGNTVVLYPTPSASAGYLRFRLAMRLGALVTATTGGAGHIGVVASVASNVVTLTTTAPSTFTTSTPLDLIRATPGFEYCGVDLTPTAVSGSTVTFAAVPTAPNALVAGDYVTLAGESPVLQLPPELHDFVAQCAANEALSHIGDSERLAAGVRAAEALARNFVTIPSPRDEGSFEVIAASSPNYPVGRGSRGFSRRG